MTDVLMWGILVLAALNTTGILIFLFRPPAICRCIRRQGREKGKAVPGLAQDRHTCRAPDLQRDKGGELPLPERRRGGAETGGLAVTGNESEMPLSGT